MPILTDGHRELRRTQSRKSDLPNELPPRNFGRVKHPEHVDEERDRAHQVTRQPEKGSSAKEDQGMPAADCGHL